MTTEDILVSSVRGILLDLWDPLGIGGNPNLADEYDRYIPRLVSTIQVSGQSELLSNELRRIEIEELEILGDDDTRRRAAKALAELV